MKNILLIGAGNIGEMIADLLVTTGEYSVTIADHAEKSLEKIVERAGLSKLKLDATSESEMAAALKDKFAVLSAAPYSITPSIAKAAHAAGVHYLDLTEDVRSTKLVMDLGKTAKAAMIPQCGLAPGFISIVAASLAKRFDSLDTLRMRVGALPEYPSNSLTYNLTWSTDGVINEYCMPCEAIVDGALITVPALEEVEHFALDGVSYEAFNTSGGLGTLCETLIGKVRSLNYRTIRYPGHRDIMKTLIQDLRLGERRDLFKEVLENAIPATMQDVVIVFVTATGRQNGKLMQLTYANKIYAKEMNGKLWSGIQITTACSICAVVDMLASGKLPQKGFVKQEEIALEDFLANRFGAAYAQDEDYFTRLAA